MSKSTLPPEVLWATKRALERAAVLQPRLRELEKRLLKYGGEALLCEHLEPDVDELVDEGWLFSLIVRRLPGDPRACHQNVAWLWQEDPQRLRIATGYALNPHGVWIQHSWLVDADLVIYETTEATFEQYYGIVYSREQARRFIEDVPRLEKEERK